jgi:hypothetical protein
MFHVIPSQAHQPITVSHKVESTSEEETVIQLDIKRENPSDAKSMGNILATTEEILFREVKNDGGDTVTNHTVQSKGKDWGE